jgi:hypothetical protein
MFLFALPWTSFCSFLIFSNTSFVVNEAVHYVLRAQGVSFEPRLSILSASPTAELAILGFDEADRRDIFQENRPVCCDGNITHCASSPKLTIVIVRAAPHF